MNLALKNYKNCYFITVSLAIALLTSGCDSNTTEADNPTLISGQRLVLGNGHQAGPLSVGVLSGPVGHAFVYGNIEPDIFVAANRHSLKPGPGLYLLKWVGRSESGAPVFRQPVKVELPKVLSGSGESGSIFQTDDRVIHGWWIRNRRIYRTTLDTSDLSFKLVPLAAIDLSSIPGPPERPTSLAVHLLGSDSIQIFLGVNDGTEQYSKKDWRKPEFTLYDGTGSYTGEYQYEYLFSSEKTTINFSGDLVFRQFSASTKEVMHSYRKLSIAELDGKKNKILITGSRYGNFSFYSLAGHIGANVKSNLKNENSIILRHRTIGPVPLAYPDEASGDNSDMIVGGEGALYYYQYTGNRSRDGSPIYRYLSPVLVENAKLYTGSLPVINARDLNNDGTLDLIVGNSEGRVLYYKNLGSNQNPEFSESEEISAAGKPIHIQSGYAGSVQGPMESRWGYVCPTITDWNGDGLEDIIMHSALSRHEVYLNIGNANLPAFGHSNPIYCMGLDLHGTWRVQPGINELEGRMAYIILDDDNEFHLYWQIDAFNVEDGGKLHLEDGSTISGSYLYAGATGRLKIVLEDWDLDGIKDLLVGTSRHSSIPNPVNGLPQSMGLKGASVLFMKNLGTNSTPSFAFPKLMKFRGEPIYLGQHSCSPEIWDHDQSDGPDLLIGEQDGRIRYFKREDLSWN